MEAGFFGLSAPVVIGAIVIFVAIVLFGLIKSLMSYKFELFSGENVLFEEENVEFEGLGRKNGHYSSVMITDQRIIAFMNKKLVASQYDYVHQSKPNGAPSIGSYVCVKRSDICVKQSEGGRNFLEIQFQILGMSPVTPIKLYLKGADKAIELFGKKG